MYSAIHHRFHASERWVVKVNLDVNVVVVLVVVAGTLRDNNQ